MKQHGIYTVLQLFILIVVNSCQYDPFAHQYTTEEPSKSDIIGEYVLEMQTIDPGVKEFLEPNSNRIANPKIILSSDTTFKFINVPDFRGVFEIKFKGLINGSGNWELETVGFIDDGIGDLEQHWGLRLSNVTSELTYAKLASNSPPYKLIFGFGDPDEGKALIFKKLKSKN